MWQKLKNICSIKGGKRIPKGFSFQKEKTSHIYIRVTDMKNELISVENLVYINDDIYSKIKNYTISKDDLYVTVAGTIGRCGAVPIQLDGMNLTENANKLTDIKINKDWLLTYLSSPFAYEAMNFKAHQVAQPKLSIETLGNLFIPIPPENEMNIIINIIKQSKILINDLKKENDALEQYVKLAKIKLLDSFFGENSSYKSYYEKTTLNKHANIVMGQSPKSEEITSIKNNLSLEFHQGKINFSNSVLRESNLYAIKYNKKTCGHSILLCVRAPVGIINYCFRTVAIGRGLCSIEPLEDLNIEYLYYYLQYSYKYFIENSTGSTFGAIGREIIRNTPFIYTNKKTQELISKKIKDCFDKIEKIKEQII